MITFPYEFDFTYISRSEWIFVGNYAVSKKIDYVVEKEIFPSRTSSPGNAYIWMSTTSNIIDISSVDPGVCIISLTIPLDLTNVSPNLKSHLELLLEQIYVQNDG